MKPINPLLPTFLLILSLITPCVQHSAADGRIKDEKQPEPKPTAEAQDITRSSQQRALALIDQLLEQSKDFGGRSIKPVKVILFQAQVADLLWDHDQPRARLLFETALKSADTLRPTRKDGKVLLSPVADLHLVVEQEILDLVLRQDTGLAERLASGTLKASLASMPEGAAADGYFRTEQATVYAQIARAVSARDPEHAAKLLRSSFNGWFSIDQVKALNALRRQSPALADDVFLHALVVVQYKPTNISNKVGILAPYVFPDIKNEANANIKMAGDVETHPPSSPAVVNSFLEFVYATVMPQPVSAQVAENNAFGSSSFDSGTMLGLLPFFEQHLPAKAPLIRRRVTAIKDSVKQAGRQDMLELEGEAWGELFRSNVQELISKGESAGSPAEKDEFYTRAAGLLVYRDANFERALALMDRVSEGQIKANLITSFRDMRAENAVKDKDAEKAYAYCGDIEEPQSRGDLLARVAELFQRSGNSKRAKVVLSEAQQVTRTIPEGSGRIYVMVRAAGVASEIDPELGFEAMKEAIEALNKVKISESADGYSTGGGRIYFSDRFDYHESFAALARADFERALLLAKSIKLSEASTLAQFAVCRGVLSRSN